MTSNGPSGQSAEVARRVSRGLGLLHLLVGARFTYSGLRLAPLGTIPDADPGFGTAALGVMIVVVTALGILITLIGLSALLRPSRAGLRALGVSTAVLGFFFASAAATAVLPPTPPMNTVGPLQESELISLAANVILLSAAVLFGWTFHRWARKQSP